MGRYDRDHLGSDGEGRQRIPREEPTAAEPDRPCAVDITYLQNGKRLLCLATVLIVFSSKVVVWPMEVYLGEGTRTGGAGNSPAGPDYAGDCGPIRSRQPVTDAGPHLALRGSRCSDSNRFEYPPAHLCYNNNVVRMIPEFTDLPGAPWAVLPVGIHHASLSVVADRFASNARRRRLFSGLVRAARNLAQAGCKRLFLDGSFVTDKPWPGDYDACWDPCGVNCQLMDPVFSSFAEGRAAQKAKFNGEFFPSTNRADAAGRTFVDFFQIEKFTGLQKGIVLIDLTSDPML